MPRRKSVGRTQSATKNGSHQGSKSAAIVATATAEIDKDEEVIELGFEEDLERICSSKMRKFIKKVLEDNGLNAQELGLIYSACPSSIANWRTIGTKRRKGKKDNKVTGFPQLGNVNDMARAHGLATWALVRCIEEELDPPPIKDYSAAVLKAIPDLRPGKAITSAALGDLAAALTRLASKIDPPATGSGGLGD